MAYMIELHGSVQIYKPVNHSTHLYSIIPSLIPNIHAPSCRWAAAGPPSRLRPATASLKIFYFPNGQRNHFYFSAVLTLPRTGPIAYARGRHGGYSK